MAEAPKRAAKFTFNEKYKQLLGQQRYGLAGTLAGMSEALINCPFEVISAPPSPPSPSPRMPATALTVPLLRQSETPPLLGAACRISAVLILSAG